VDAATQAAIEKRIVAAGIKPPDTYVLEHGYCRSVYVKDPNGMILEFTLDHPEAGKISSDRRTRAHHELKQWLAGNHQSNNTYR
jgi:glyoxylase I family protein